MKLLNRKLEFPSTYVIIFAVTLLAAAATWFVPGGEYVTGDDGVTFVPQESVPQTWQIMTSLYEGFTAQAGIIVFLLIIGGAFWIVNSAKAVDAGIHSFLAFTSRLERFRVLRAVGVNNIVLVLIMLLFSVFGAVFGMSEETIAFTVLIVPLAISMGYDSIVGVCMVYVAAHVGFAGAVLNPFTVGVAQNLSGLPMFSGFEYRLVCWAVLNLAMIIFVLRYAHKVHRDPRRSVMYEADARWREKAADASSKPDVLRTRSSWIAFARRRRLLQARRAPDPLLLDSLRPVLGGRGALLHFLCGRLHYKRGQRHLPRRVAPARRVALLYCPILYCPEAQCPVFHPDHAAVLGAVPHRRGPRLFVVH